MTEWISVKDKQPPQKSLLCTDGKQIHVVLFSKDGYRCVGFKQTGLKICSPYKEDRKFDLWVFTHWMLLPKPPEVNGE